jgi:hypothetical protein
MMGAFFVQAGALDPADVSPSFANSSALPSEFTERAVSYVR